MSDSIERFKKWREEKLAKEKRQTKKPSYRPKVLGQSMGRVLTYGCPVCEGKGRTLALVRAEGTETVGPFGQTLPVAGQLVAKCCGTCRGKGWVYYDVYHRLTGGGAP